MAFGWETRSGPRLFAAGVLFALMVGSRGAAAQPSPPAPLPRTADSDSPHARRRLAVLILAGNAVDSSMASDLTEVLVAALAARASDDQFIGKEELQARLGQDEASSRQCVESPICLTRVGVELAVDEIVAGAVAAVPGGFRLSLVRQEVPSGEVKGRTSEDVPADSSVLIQAVQRAATELYREAERPSRLRVESNVEGAEVFLDDQRVGMTPLVLADVPPGDHRVRVDAVGFRAARLRVHVRSGGHSRVRLLLEDAPYERTIRLRGPDTVAVIACWTSLGLAAAAGGLGTAFGLRSQDEVAQGTSRRAAEEELGRHESEALVANVSFASAAALATTGLYLLIFQRKAVFGERAPVPRAQSTGGPWF